MITQKLFNQAQDLVIKTKREYDTMKETSLEVITEPLLCRMLELADLNHRIAFNNFQRVISLEDKEEKIDEEIERQVDDEIEEKYPAEMEELANDNMLDK